MLTKFIFRNFKSFRDDTILDLSASKITEYADHLFDTGIEKVLPTVPPSVFFYYTTTQNTCQIKNRVETSTP